MLTIDQIRKVSLPINIWRNNNLSLSNVSPYNNAVNLYNAIVTVTESLNLSGETNLGTSQALTTTTVTSSSGDDVTILGADATRSGVMTADHYNTLTNLVTLSGVPNEAVDLGTFTGTTIPDNSTIKEALQELETSLEVVSSNSVNVDELIVLTGVAALATDLGTFTGTTISNNTTIKNALQELETYAEALSLTVDGNGIYDGSGTIPAATVATTSGTFEIDNNGTDTVRIGRTSDYYFELSNSAINIGNVSGGSKIQINNFGVELRGGTSEYFSVGTSGGNMIISGPFIITDSTGEGLKYNADYSATFAARSLVDKAYVDGITDAIADDVTNLVTLTGVATDAVNLGTFTGTTISDSVTIKAALQELETAVEGISGVLSTEDVQDAIGTILLDSTTIDFTYNDATPTITAGVKSNSVSNTQLTTATGGIYKGSGTIASGVVATITAASDFVINYSAGNTGFMVNDVSSTAAIFSKDNEQYVAVDNTKVYMGSGTSQLAFIDGALRLYDSDSTHYISFATPATGVLTSNYSMILPASNSAGALTNDGSGNLSWDASTSAKAYGELTETGGSTAITVTTAGTYYKWGTSTAGPTNLVTASTVNDNLTINSGADGIYVVSFNASFTGPNNAIVAIAATKNGTPISGCIAEQRLVTGTNIAAVSATGLISLASTDTVDLRVTSNTNGDTVTLEEVNLVIYRL